MIIKSNKLLLISALLVGLFFSGCGRAVPAWSVAEPIDGSDDPQQTQTLATPFIKNIPGGRLTMTPVADYRIAAMVVSKKNYYNGWGGQVAPVDLALVWGELIEPEYDQYLSYTQSNRWYFFRYRAGAPFETRFVSEHSSNHHIIPANDNVRAALGMISKKEMIVLEGYLVNIRGDFHGSAVWWNSSQSRDDTGDGACELFYVKSIRIKNLIYQ